MAKHFMDMTSGNIRRQIVAFALPVFLGELFQLSYSIIDSAIVGKYVGLDALAAVGASETITKVIIGFFSGLSLGCTVIVAAAFGRKDEEELRSAVHTVILLSLGLGVLLGVLGFACTGLFIRMMDIPPETVPLATVYLHIYFGGLVGLILYNTVSGILRAVGDSKRPLYFLIFSSILNTVLDVLFVAVFHWGVRGAAWATITSQLLSAALCLFVIMVTEEPWQFRWKGHLDLRAMKDIFRIGIPVGMQKSIVSMSNVLVLSHIGAFSTDCLAGWVVYSKFSHVFTIVSQSFSASETTFISQNLGAKSYKRAEEGILTTFSVSILLEAVLIAVVLLVREPIIRIFGDSASMISYANLFVLYLTPLQVLHIFMTTYVAVLRAGGRAGVATMFMILGLVAGRQLYLWIVTPIINTPLSVGFAWPLGWLLSGLMIYGYYRLKMRRELFEPQKEG